MNQILQISKVSKKFKALQALEAVSLTVDEGERIALLGHNGAGKTTLFRLVLGFLNSDTGSISICGHRPGSSDARRCVSYLPESVAFPKMLTGREIVTYYVKLKGADKADVMRALEQVELADAADQRCGTYSKGMRQRLGLAQALVGSPKLLLLDEPTSGLDPLSRQRFYALISQIAKDGTAVLLSSHGLSELEAKTDRVAILRQGKLVANAPLTDLQQTANLPSRIRLRSSQENVDHVHQQFGGERINGVSVEFDCWQRDKMAHLAAISKLGNAVNDVELSHPSLDEVYRYYSTHSDFDGDVT